MPPIQAALLVSTAHMASMIMAAAGHSGLLQILALAFAARTAAGVERPRSTLEYTALLLAVVLGLASSLAGGWAGGAALALLASGLAREPLLALVPLSAAAASHYAGGGGSEALALAAFGGGLFATASLLEPYNLGFTVRDSNTRRATGLALASVSAAYAFAPMSAASASALAASLAGLLPAAYAYLRLGDGRIRPWLPGMVAYAAAVAGTLAESPIPAAVAVVALTYATVAVRAEDQSRWMAPTLSWLVGIGVYASLTPPPPSLVAGALAAAGLAASLARLDLDRLSVEGVELVDFTRRLCGSLATLARDASRVYPGLGLDEGECVRVLLEAD